MSRSTPLVGRLRSFFSLAASNLYDGRSVMHYTWFTKARPEGRRGKFLFIIVNDFNPWAESASLEYLLLVLTGGLAAA